MERSDLGVQPVYVEPVGEPGERRPVEIHQGGVKEQSLGVGEPQTPYARLTVEGAFNSRNLDLQAGFGGELFNAVDDEAVARSGVRKTGEHQPDQRQSKKGCKEPFGGAHQNA